MIGIIDYGMANLRSVQKAFERLGHQATIIADPNQVHDMGKIVLPGVGAFRDAIARLRETGMDQSVRDFIESGRRFLGICLGYQLLFTSSYEEGIHSGLDIFRGDVVRFENRGLKIPHMGWSPIQPVQKIPFFDGIGEGSHVYFVHSYYVKPNSTDLVASWTDYPDPFASSIAVENVVATQFHPEKSQRIGLRLLKNFADW